MDSSPTAHRRGLSPLLKGGLCLAVLAGLAALLPHTAGLSRLPGILATARPEYLAIMAALHVSCNALRALRLHRILSYGQSYAHTFHLCNAGYMANGLLPLRAGEVCMAALLAPDLRGGGAEALSKLLVDRLLDLVSVAVFFLATLLFLIPSGHAAQAEFGAALATLAALGGVALALLSLSIFEDALSGALRALGRKLGRDATPLVNTLRAAVEALRSLFRNGVFAQAVGLSLLTWTLISASYLAGMPMLGIEPRLACAVLAMCFAVAGLVTMPLPGGVGATHGAIVIALSLFGIPFELALAYAIIYHALSTGLNILLGLAALRGLRLSFGKLQSIARRGRRSDQKNTGNGPPES